MYSFEGLKQGFKTQVSSMQRHPYLSKYHQSKFIDMYLKDAGAMFHCMHFCMAQPEHELAQEYFSSLTDYVVEHFMDEWVRRKTHRFIHRHKNKLQNAILKLHQAIDKIQATGLIPAFDAWQEFNKTREFFTRFNSEYFKKIKLVR
jgi:hypothetical protein